MGSLQVLGVEEQDDVLPEVVFQADRLELASNHSRCLEDWRGLLDHGLALEHVGLGLCSGAW